MRHCKLERLNCQSERHLKEDPSLQRGYTLREMVGCRFILVAAIFEGITRFFIHEQHPRGSSLVLKDASGEPSRGILLTVIGFQACWVDNMRQVKPWWWVCEKKTDESRKCVYLGVCEWYCKHFQDCFFFKQKALQDISVLRGFNMADTAFPFFVTKSLSSLKGKLAKS